jgi:hypothetical protein
MAFWNHNFFVSAVPSLGVWASNEFVRGAISGVGLVTAAAGIRELAGVFGTRESGEAERTPPPA